MPKKRDMLAEQITNSTFTVVEHLHAAVSAANLDCLANKETRERCFAAMYDPDLG